MSEILDIVNENDEVIGRAERDEVHRTGLVCRLAYVCFYTTDREIILQKRSLTKKNDAGRMTTTVSGHVASGQTYLEAAIRETFEDAGVELEASDLIDMGVVRADYVQGTYLSNAMRGMYAYEFHGDVANLKIEDGEGAGFVSLPIDELEKQFDAEPSKFATILTDTVGRDLVQGIKRILED